MILAVVLDVAVVFFKLGNFDGFYNRNDGNFFGIAKEYIHYMKPLAVIGVFWSILFIMSNFKLTAWLKKTQGLISIISATYSFISIMWAQTDPNGIFKLSDSIMSGFGNNLILGVTAITILYGRLMTIFPDFIAEDGTAKGGVSRSRSIRSESILSWILTSLAIFFDGLIVFVGWGFTSFYETNEFDIFATIDDYIRFMKPLALIGLIWLLLARLNKFGFRSARLGWIAPHYWVALCVVGLDIISIALAQIDPDWIFLVSDTLMIIGGSYLLLGIGALSLLYGRLATLFPQMAHVVDKE